jgi:hypothetical protein
MLILDNIGLSVNEDVRVYSSVMEAWRVSLVVMENLVNGIPQAAETGAAILGLSAWHLYPDMAVAGPQNLSILMKDPAIRPGGVLTIGMRRPEHHLMAEAKSGIYWSLSLAHLRYYGRPILKHGEFSVNTSRIHFQHFIKIVFGCLLDSWGLSADDITIAVDIFVATSTCLEYNVASNPFRIPDDVSALKQESHWFHMMAEVAKGYQNSSGDEKIQTLRYIKLGLRRSSFLNTLPFIHEVDDMERLSLQQQLDTPSIFFGLTEPESLLACMKSTEEQINYLRRVAALNFSGWNSEALLIRFMWRGEYAYASALPRKSTESNDEGAENHLPHERWYFPAKKSKLQPGRSRYTVNRDY